MNDTGSNNHIRAFWFSSNNIGDNINSFIINKLSGKNVCLDQTKDHYIVCGSILSISNAFSAVWGAGFDWEHHSSIDVHPGAKVIAVRGDLSAKNSKRHVEAIGDPALLLPLLFPITKEVKHKIGIVPHWSNIERCATTYPECYIVNPLMPLHLFLEEINSCECIFSESLHGLIIADAYGIKNAWIKMGGDVGDGFKYRDYYSTTINSQLEAISVLDVSCCRVHDYKYNLKTFLNSCPFYNGKYS